MITPEIRYTQKELIAGINKEFGKNTLNRSMLVYMRDIRRLIPKPIRRRLVSTKRGGAYSYYLEDTYKLLQLIYREKIHHGKNLKQIQAEHQHDIDLAMFATEKYRQDMDEARKRMVEHFKKVSQTFTEGIRKAMEPLINMRFEDIIIQHLEETIVILKKDDPAAIDKALENLKVGVRIIQKHRRKQKLAESKTVVKETQG